MLRRLKKHGTHNVQKNKTHHLETSLGMKQCKRAGKQLKKTNEVKKAKCKIGMGLPNGKMKEKKYNIQGSAGAVKRLTGGRRTPLCIAVPAEHTQH